MTDAQKDRAHTFAEVSLKRPALLSDSYCPQDSRKALPDGRRLTALHRILAPATRRQNIPNRGTFHGKLVSMPVRLIALDIDGTLLDSRWQLPEANRAAITEATRRGIEVALVTG